MYDEIVQLISNVGFPIGCCIVLFIQQNKLTQTLSEISSTLQGLSKRLDDIEEKVAK